MLDRTSVPTPRKHEYHVLSFLPKSGQLKYPALPPGLYIFIQDKTSKRIFLWPTQTGHGHPFEALRVNKELDRPSDDYTWLTAAGEMIVGYGGEILGVSYCTGYFHDQLGLTEPKTESLMPAYQAFIKAKLETDLLPFERYFLVKDWENQILTHSSRLLLFRGSGAFKISTQEELAELRVKLKLDGSQEHPEHIRSILEGLLRSIEKISQTAAKRLAKKFSNFNTCPPSILQHTLAQAQPSTWKALSGMPAKMPSETALELMSGDQNASSSDAQEEKEMVIVREKPQRPHQSIAQLLCSAASSSSLGNMEEKEIANKRETKLSNSPFSIFAETPQKQLSLANNEAEKCSPRTTVSLP